MKPEFSLFDRVCLTFTSVGVIFLFLAIWMAPVVPLQDSVEWAWQGHAMGEVLRGERSDIEIKDWPVPNMLTQSLLGLAGYFHQSLLGTAVLFSFIMFLDYF